MQVGIQVFLDTEGAAFHLGLGKSTLEKYSHESLRERVSPDVCLNFLFL